MLWKGLITIWEWEKIQYEHEKKYNMSELDKYFLSSNKK